MSELLAVVVGSRLHGLAEKDSDYDIRRIITVPLQRKLSPFYRDKEKRGEGDDVSYELAHFCKMAAQGNPTALEVLWSNQYVKSSLFGDALQEGRKNFLDMGRVYHAHLGYAYSDMQKIPCLTGSKKWKKQSAVLRVLYQGAEILSTSTFDPSIYGKDDFLKNLRRGLVTDTKFYERYQAAKEQMNHAWNYCKPSTFDQNWIEQFIVDAYTKENM